MASQLVALTGGIGAGKSTVAGALRDRGARLIDADQIAREVVDPTTPTGRRVLRSLTARFGDAILQMDGTLDRATVAALVFDDDVLRHEYNAIVHPAIREATDDAIAAEQGRSRGVIVHEIPLLSKDSEPLPWRYDLVVTVEAAIDERVRRLTAHRGYSQEHALARIEAQGDESGRTAIADVVVRTDGTLDETMAAVGALWRRLDHS